MNAAGWIQIAIAVILLVTALTMVWNIRVSQQAVRRQLDENRKLAESQLLLQFLREYGSHEFSSALKQIEIWWNSRGPEKAVTEFRSKFRSLGPKLGTRDVEETEAARRRLWQYFYGAYRLYNQGFISRSLLRAATQVPALTVFLDQVKPLLEFEPGSEEDLLYQCLERDVRRPHVHCGESP